MKIEPFSKVKLTIGLILITGIAVLGSMLHEPAMLVSLAQEPINVLETQSSAAEPPFQLPFAGPPGPDTWLLGQPYGNTIGAYFQRYTTYGASGGIHFGLDLSAPCGTEILAVADGVVFAVDGPFGSPPHNLMIDHPELGYASMYGHLLESPQLTPGEAVKQGQVVALVGDSGEDCFRSPHLHLEIRDLNHIRKVNPINLIEADWSKLATVGGGSQAFMRDLDEPRKWQFIFNQPEAQTGGPIVNDFARTWPQNWRKADPENQNRPRPATSASTGAGPDPSQAVPDQTPTPEAPPFQSLPGARQITRGNCCTGFYWSEDSLELRFVDQPSAVDAVGVWAVQINQPDETLRLVTERLGRYNEERSLVAYPDQEKGVVVIERLGDGRQWELDTDGNSISFSPGGRLLWTNYDSDVPWRSRQAEVWMADIDGSNAAILATLPRGGPVAWLPDNSLMVASRIPPRQDTRISKLSLEDGSLTELTQLPRVRGAAFSPDKRFMVYLIRHDPDEAKNGLWLLDLQSPALEPVPLPFFGSYRWRDNERLLYIPFDLKAKGLVIYEYNTVTGSSRQLVPADSSLLELQIANNDWRISPDGTKIGLMATDGPSPDGIWVIDIGP